MKDTRPARYALAPASDASDLYAAGYDGNRFASREEARAAIVELRALGGDFDHDWVVVELPGNPDVDALIRRSANENSIVHVPYVRDAADYLLEVSEDHVESREVAEYWGTLDSGEAWRVHLDKTIAALETNHG